ncbi:hypothetical protein KCU59_g49, partial [Aureobasidium melanogenum]
MDTEKEAENSYEAHDVDLIDSLFNTAMTNIERQSGPYVSRFMSKDTHPQFGHILSYSSEKLSGCQSMPIYPTACYICLRQYGKEQTLFPSTP